jgi:hypothetical protein
MAHRLRRSIVALPILLALTSPAVAADADSEETPSALMTEAMSKMVRALEMMIQSIPQYEKPEITDDGDIIIRRKHPETKKGPPRLPDPDAPEPPEKGRTI